MEEKLKRTGVAGAPRANGEGGQDQGKQVVQG